MLGPVWSLLSVTSREVASAIWTLADDCGVGSVGSLSQLMPEDKLREVSGGLLLFDGHKGHWVEDCSLASIGSFLLFRTMCMSLLKSCLSRLQLGSQCRLSKVEELRAAAFHLASTRAIFRKPPAGQVWSTHA